MAEDFTHRIMSTLTTIGHLGAPPELSMSLFELVKTGDYSFDDIAIALSRNPPLCVSLLKLANSVYYSRGQAVATITQAIAKVGLKTTVHFVLAFEMIGMFEENDTGKLFEKSLFWKNSLAVALFAQEVGAQLNVDYVESLFLSALLRDIGILILRQYFPDLFEDMCSLMHAKKIGFDDACIAICSFDHRYVAFLLALRWNLPKHVLFTFQPPTEKLYEYEKIMMNRNIIHYAETMFTMRKLYLWDVYAAHASVESYAIDVAPAFVEDSITWIVAEVNELFGQI